MGQKTVVPFRMVHTVSPVSLGEIQGLRRLTIHVPFETADQPKTVGQLLHTDTSLYQCHHLYAFSPLHKRHEYVYTVCSLTATQSFIHPSIGSP